jgi:hypothetical protein
MSATTTMTQEQLMKVKIKYLEDRITTMEKSLSRVNNILGRFQMTENQEQGFKDIEIYESVGGGFDFDDEPTSKDNDNELI